MRPRPAAVAAATAVAAALVTLAGMAAARGSVLSVHPVRWQPAFLRSLARRSGRPTPHPAASGTATPAPVGGAGGSAGLPHWVSVAAVVAALVLVAALLALVAARLLRASAWRAVAPAPLAPPPAAAAGPDDAARARVAAHVEAAVGDLAEEADPRAAVIGCWLRLERAAADAGVERAPSETSAELAHRVLTAFDVAAADLARLNRLYRAARYGPRPVGEVERDAARAALLAVRRGLGAVRAGTAAP